MPFAQRFKSCEIIRLQDHYDKISTKIEIMVSYSLPEWAGNEKTNSETEIKAQKSKLGRMLLVC